MKRRVHPKVQMLHGARLAVLHYKDRMRIHPDDADALGAMHEREYSTLTQFGRRAYGRMSISLAVKSVLNG